jgi:hypothetical protein
MNTQTEAVRPPAESAPIPGITWLLIAVFALGLGALVVGLNSADTQPDLRLFTVSYLVLLGVSQAGVVFCAIMRIIGARWSRPYYRLAELTTLAFLPFAVLGFLLIFFFAQDELFYWLEPAEGEHLSAWLNINWLLIRNLFGLLLFYGLSVIYVRKSLGPDLATASGASSSHTRLTQQLYTLSPWVILAYVICSTFFAWDFAMMLIPHWHSTVFPIFFWFGNGAAGIAALIAFPAVLGCSKDGSTVFGPDQIRCLGMMVTAFTLLWLYLFWAQFFVIWFGNLPQETEPVWRQMYGHYAPYFWTMMAGCFFVPFVSLLFARVKRSLAAMCALALGINLGNWLSKYLMVVPALSADSRPFEHWVDLIIALGLLAGFLATLILLARRLPRFSNWEMEQTSGD